MLPVEKRKQYFKDIGYTYNKSGILSFQKRYMLRKSDYDGIYGPNTENALLTVWNTRTYTKNFKPEEFRCDCGGKYCCGFPSYMKQHELTLIQDIRDHWNKPVKVTCGLRCAAYNRKLNGSIVNSKHLTGQAIDFYQKGVTDTLANRKKSIKWIKTRPFFTYAYGNGINSNGYAVKAAYMGNCLHVDTK